MACKSVEVALASNLTLEETNEGGYHTRLDMPPQKPCSDSDCLPPPEYMSIRASFPNFTPEQVG